MDPNENLGKEEQFKNLFGYNLEGKQLWVAELPTSKKADVYYKIKKKRNTLSPWTFSLIAYSFCSYECEIDIKTGKIIKSVFYK
ncbi:MAG: hypothetical protein G3M70_02010 [Candidatus Nitronauta litoralis]|uniref:PepSY domain-containing protein n=1 Tax=Candidatus Nitronauta litoralis TaxID=2705533 RepID=A0A7T0BZB9_9BACT|nr:MAG: hypothetical protein G3M70_02010 [Candidatus Nitronauta litoralis]